VLQVHGLSIDVGGRRVLEDASFVVAAGDKVGVVGRNGAGKTSLLKVLAGLDPPAAGRVAGTGTIGYLSQDPAALRVEPAGRALDRVLSGRGLDELSARLERLRRALEEEATPRGIARYGRAEEEFAAAGGYGAEAEAERLLVGLGLRKDRIESPLAVLSGGERRRVELARILFAEPETLLLDEPTNHLDADAKTWLLQMLRAYRGAVVVVSHDLDLLDEAITRVLHLEREGLAAGRVTEYRGTYSKYRAARAADEARQARLAERQEGEIRRLATLADAMRHQTAARARKAKTLDRRVERLRQNHREGPERTRAVRVRVPPPPPAGRTVLTVDGLTKGFGRVELWRDLAFGLGRGERMVVLGLNGAGKTTLLRVLTGELEADGGEAHFGWSVSVGYYAQEHDGLRPGTTALEHLQGVADLPVGELRGLLGAFGLPAEVAFQDVATLSGGEKTKLALAALVTGRHNLLLLDEPTNDLDPPSREAVGEALANWGGAMIVVSHDADFVERLAPDLALVLPEGTVDRWSDEWADLVELS